MEIGSYKSKRHIAIIGTPVEFYIWNRQVEASRNCESQWIRGRDAFEIYNKLRKLYEHGNKKEFVTYAVETWEKFQKR